MYSVIPIWFAAGIADWICHRKTHIEKTSGIKESFIHLIMFAEAGIPLLAALFFEINALVIALMIGMFLIHEATALWDISYAVTARRVSPVEQMTHSFLEIVPLMAIGEVVALHWGQFLALSGVGRDTADFSFRWKTVPLPYWYISMVMVAIVLLAFVPYVEEFCRCLRVNSTQGIPPTARGRWFRQKALREPYQSSPTACQSSETHRQAQA
jgi:hypothetical protein